MEYIISKNGLNMDTNNAQMIINVTPLLIMKDV